LLWRAALAAYGIRAEVRGADRAFQVVAYGDDAVRLARLYLLFGPPLLKGRDDRLKNHKLAEAVELGAKGALNIRWEGPRRTEGGLVAADLIISEGDIEVKYNVYLRDKVELQFNSTDRGRVELAALLLRLAGVDAEVERVGSGGVWQVRATTDKLAAGRKELRDAIADIVREALAKKDWVDAGRAKRWLEKLEGGITLREGWPKYNVRLTRSGALEVRYTSTNPGNIEREAQRLRDMGLDEGRHFTMKMPEGGEAGYVSILKEGLAYAAWLSIRGSEGQRELAAGFVEYILQRAGEEGEDVRKKALEVVERGREVGSLRLEGFEGRVEVDGRIYVVKVTGWGAEIENQDDNKLLKLKITAEVGRVEGEHTIVDRVVREYTITFGRYGKDNAAVGYAVARADAPDGREADAERLSALIKALTGREPRVRRMKNGEIVIKCTREHLEGFMRYAELAKAIAEWLEETGRR